MNKKVNEYIQRQRSPNREICQRLRQLILRTFPGIAEEIKGGVPCYGITKDRSYGKFYIVSLKDHVNLGFSVEGLTQPQQRLLEGSGKTMKHIKVFSVQDIDEEYIVSLLKMVYSA
jgi:hypothetical protein